MLEARSRTVARALMLAALVALPAAVAGGASREAPPASENLLWYGPGWVLDANGDRLDDGLNALLDSGATEPVMMHVHYDRRPTASDAARLLALPGVTLAHVFVHWDDIEVVAPPATASRLLAQPGVLSVEYIPPLTPDLAVATKATRIIPASGTPIVDGVNHADAVRNAFGLQGEGMVIAILDGGVDNLHEALDDLDDDPLTFDPKLVQKVVNGRVLFGGVIAGVAECVDPVDEGGHGTHVAGIAAGTGIGGYEGAAPAARIVDVRIATGLFFLAQGLDWMLAYNEGTSCYGDPGEDRIDVASMSYSIGQYSPGSSLNRKITDVARAGITYVVSAGNAGPGPSTLTKAAEGAIFVANSYDRSTVIRDDDTLEISSSRGPREADGDADWHDELRPDVAAPGTYITAPAANRVTGYVTFTGTSMSAPLVAGVAALMLQANPALRPVDLGSNERMGDAGAVPVRDLLIRSASTRLLDGEDGIEGRFGKLWSSGWGYGLLDAQAAVTLAWAAAGHAPDLLVESFDLPAQARPGDIIPITAVIRNRALASVADVHVRIEIDGTLHHEVDLALIGELGTAALVASAWTVTPGRHQMRVIVDGDDTIAESDETNNAFTRIVDAREVLRHYEVPAGGLANAGLLSLTLDDTYIAVELRVECKFTQAAAGFVSPGPEGREVWACAQNQRALIPQVDLAAGDHTIWHAGYAAAPVTIEVSGVRDLA